MALTTQQVALLTAAGFTRQHYPNQEDLGFYAKDMPCKALSVLIGSSSYDEMFHPVDIANVEVVSDYHEVQIVVANCDYVLTHIALESEEGLSILSECGAADFVATIRLETGTDPQEAQ